MAILRNQIILETDAIAEVRGMRLEWWGPKSGDEFFILTIVNTGEDVGSITVHKDGYVAGCHVNERWQRKGIGTALLTLAWLHAGKRLWCGPEHLNSEAGNNLLLKYQMDYPLRVWSQPFSD